MARRRIAVVKLDDVKRAADGGVVIEVAEGPLFECIDRYRDRDGARPEALRFWLASPGLQVGDRVSLGV